MIQRLRVQIPDYGAFELAIGRIQFFGISSEVGEHYKPHRIPMRAGVKLQCYTCAGKVVFSAATVARRKLF